MTAASLLVFLVGMAAGWLLNDILDRLDLGTPEATLSTEHRTRRRRKIPGLAGLRARLARMPRSRTAVGAAALALAAAALIIGAANSRAAREQNGDLARAAQHNAQVSACQAQFNERVTRSLAVRAQLSDQRTRVLVRFMSDLFAQPIPTSLVAALAQQARDRRRFAEFRADVARLSERLAGEQVPVLGGQCGTPAAVPSPAARH
jgi:hypothetical protein